MSVQAMAWVFEQSRAKGATRLVLLAIANHVDGRGVGWVPVRQVLAEANVSLKSYHRAVQELVESGELGREMQEGGGRRCPDALRPNLFRFPALDTDSAPSPGCPPPPQDDQEPPPQDDHPPKGSRPRSRPRSRASTQASTIAIDFEAWWSGYPRKVGKEAARKAYLAALKKATADELVSGLRRAVEHWGRCETADQFIPHASTWLNAGRWADEFEPAKPARLEEVPDTWS